VNPEYLDGDMTGATGVTGLEPDSLQFKCGTEVLGILGVAWKK